VLESAVLRRVKEVLETFAENDGKIDQKEFNDAVSICKKATLGKRNDIQVKRMVVDVIEDNTLKVKQGMFNHWYDSVKKEVANTWGCGQGGRPAWRRRGPPAASRRDANPGATKNPGGGCPRGFQESRR